MTEVITYSFSKRHEQLRAVVARYAILHLERSGEQLDDVVQNILIKIWQNWNRYHGLTTKELNWLAYTITRNYMINAYKRSRAQMKRQQSYNQYKSMYLWSWPDEMLVAEGIKLFNMAIDELPPAQRLAFLHHHNDQRCRDVAMTLQKSERTIRNQLLSAQQVIANFLKEKWDLNIPFSKRKRLYRMEQLN